MGLAYSKEMGEPGDVPGQKSFTALNFPDFYTDSSSVSPDERPYYQPDSYYTFYSYPGTYMSGTVIPFEERKRMSYPSRRGLYVAEILLLEYCSKGKYPKPESGYPGFWWFKYGIRDVGHALESLEKRGFVQWASLEQCLNRLRVNELKQLLTEADLPKTGKKTDLIKKIMSEIPEEGIKIRPNAIKYELTDIGIAELEENGYVPYMHRHRYQTLEGGGFTVWDINKLFPDGNAADWRQIVGSIELSRFGIDMANAEPVIAESEEDCSLFKDDMRRFLAEKRSEIMNGITTDSDGYIEESQGLAYKNKGRDKEALINFYISIGKRFDAPVLYFETAALLRKYEMFEEELSVIDAGLRNAVLNEWNRKKLLARRIQLQELIQ